MPVTERAPRRGFILPTTLLVMTLLTVMLTAAFILASAEFRATDNTLANSRALALAEAGLESYYSQYRGLDTSSTYDSVRITLTNGYADVVGRRVRPTNGSHNPLWLIRSLGTATDPRQPGQPQGQRAVAQLAELDTGVIPARAAITAVNGILMIGNGGNPITGSNYTATVTGCTDPGSPAGDSQAYSVATATGQGPDAGKNLAVQMQSGSYAYTTNGSAFNAEGFNVGQEIIATGFTNAANNGVATITNISGKSMWVSKTLVNEGANNNRAISVYSGNYLSAGAGGVPGRTEQIGSTSAEYDSTHIDWASVLAGDFTPDYTNTLPSTCTGSACSYNSYYWTSDVHVPAGSRRMLLISTGNVYLDSGAHVDGVILAGGALNATGGNQYFSIVHGMVVSGLNCEHSSCSVPQDSIKAGQPSSGTIRWSWCYTHAAVGDLNGFVAMKNTWVDTWSLY